jgi:CxxC motif-containing protein
MVKNCKKRKLISLQDLMKFMLLMAYVKSNDLIVTKDVSSLSEGQDILISKQ